MITAEEFFSNKIKEQNPNREVVTLSQELITAEQGMRWANEFQQLHLHDVVGRSGQFSCPLPETKGCDRRKIDDEEGRWEFCNTCKREWAR